MEEEILRTEVGEKLKGIAFPKEKEELVSELGEKKIKLKGGETCRLAEIIEEAPKGVYTTKDECTRVVLDYVDTVRARVD